MTTKSSKSLWAILLLVFITFCWGITFVFIKWTLAELDTYYFLFLRFALATFLLSILFRKKLQNIKSQTIVAGLVLSTMLAGALITQTEALRFTTASNSALITGLYLVFVPMLLAMFGKKSRVPMHSFLGAIVSFIGLYLLTRYNHAAINKGDVLTLFCALFAAGHIIFTDIFAKKHPMLPLAIFQFLFVAIICGGVSLVKESYTLSISPNAWLTVVFCGVFCTAIAFTVQIWAQRTIDPTRAGVIFALEALFGALAGHFLAGEQFTQIALIGAWLMIIGMALAEIKPMAKYLIDKLVG